MGLIDASKPRSYAPRKGLLAPVLDQTTTTGSIDGGYMGGDGTASRDAVHGKSFDMMNNQELADYSKERAAGGFLSRNFESLAPSLVASLVMGGLEKNQLAAELGNRGMSNPADFVGGQIAGAANTGMNNAGGVPNPELAGRSGGGSNDLSPSDMAQISAAAEAANNDPRSGGMAHGGIVKRSGLLGPNPPGPDQGYQALRDQERVITPEAYAGFSKATKAEIDAAMKKAKK